MPSVWIIIAGIIGCAGVGLSGMLIIGLRYRRRQRRTTAHGTPPLAAAPAPAGTVASPSSSATVGDAPPDRPDRIVPLRSPFDSRGVLPARPRRGVLPPVAPTVRDTLLITNQHHLAPSPDVGSTEADHDN